MLPTITASGLRGLRVPLPPMEVQESAAARYRACLDQIERLEARVCGINTNNMVSLVVTAAG